MVASTTRCFDVNVTEDVIWCSSYNVLRYRVGGIPAKTVKGERLILFIGIIDILQSYRYGSQKL